MHKENKYSLVKLYTSANIKLMTHVRSYKAIQRANYSFA